MQRQVRWRWAFNGLVIGIIYVLADIMFEWRGPKYYPWVGEEAIVNNLDQMFTGIALITVTVIALALGYWKDRRTLRGEYWGDHRNIINPSTRQARFRRPRWPRPDRPWLGRPAAESRRALLG
jgi:hypothetical protein